MTDKVLSEKDISELDVELKDLVKIIWQSSKGVEHAHEVLKTGDILNADDIEELGNLLIVLAEKQKDYFNKINKYCQHRMTTIVDLEKALDFIKIEHQNKMVNSQCREIFKKFVLLRAVNIDVQKELNKYQEEIHNILDLDTYSDIQKDKSANCRLFISKIGKEYDPNNELDYDAIEDCFGKKLSRALISPSSFYFADEQMLSFENHEDPRSIETDTDNIDIKEAELPPKPVKINLNEKADIVEDGLKVNIKYNKYHDYKLEVSAQNTGKISNKRFEADLKKLPIENPVVIFEAIGKLGVISKTNFLKLVRTHTKDIYNDADTELISKKIMDTMLKHQYIAEYRLVAPDNKIAFSGFSLTELGAKRYSTCITKSLSSGPVYIEKPMQNVENTKLFIRSYLDCTEALFYISGGQIYESIHYRFIGHSNLTICLEVIKNKDNKSTHVFIIPLSHFAKVDCIEVQQCIEKLVSMFNEYKDSEKRVYKILLICNDSAEMSKCFDGIKFNECVYFMLMHDNYRMVDLSGANVEDIFYYSEVTILKKIDDVISNDVSKRFSAESDIVLEASEAKTPNIDPQTTASVTVLSDENQGENNILTALELLSKGMYAESLLLLKASGGLTEEAKNLFKKVSWAINNPECHYTYVYNEYIEFSNIILGTNPNIQYSNLETLLNISAHIFYYFSTRDLVSDELITNMKIVFENQANENINKIPELKNLIWAIHSFIKRNSHSGLNICFNIGAVQRDNLNKLLVKATQDLKYQLATCESMTKHKVNHKKVVKLIDKLFNKNSGLLVEEVKNALNDHPEFDRLVDFCNKFTPVDVSKLQEFESAQMIDLQKIENYLDEIWESIDLGSNWKNEKFKGVERTRNVNRVHEVLQKLVHYYVIKKDINIQSNNNSVISERDEIFAHLEKTSEALRKINFDLVEDNAGKYCLLYVIDTFRERIRDCAGYKRQKYFYVNLLMTGQVELTKEFLPDDESWRVPHPEIQGYTLWERVLWHCELLKQNNGYGWMDVIKLIFDDSDGSFIYEDYGTASLIQEYLYDMGLMSKDEWFEKFSNFNIEKSVEIAKNHISEQELEFVNTIEMLENYGRIAAENKNQVKLIRKTVSLYKQHAITSNNFGFFKRVIKQCLSNVEIGSEQQKKSYLKRLNILKSRQLEIENDTESKWPIFKSIQQMIESKNFTVAEDYMQLYDREGCRSVPSVLSVGDNPLEQFIYNSDDLYRICTSDGMQGKDMNKIYEKYKSGNSNFRFKNKDITSADAFIKNWYGAIGSIKLDKIRGIMEQLSFDVQKAKDVIKNPDAVIFRVELNPIDQSISSFKHPIAAFGTKASQSGIRVICLAGKYSANSLKNRLLYYGNNLIESATIVLLDYALPLAERRQLAEAFKVENIPHPFVVIDRVMALYLANFTKMERGTAMLNSALPFSYLQPYVPHSSTIMPPDMFIGRTEELTQILDFSGPNLVYGGRQLGKTALLRRAQTMQNLPETGMFAVYLSLQGKNHLAVLETIIKALIQNNILNEDASDIKTWDGFEEALKIRISGKVDYGIKKLLLLMDEADTFISSCEKVKYRPLEILKDLQLVKEGVFKFVMAGLRDVVRFDKKTLGNNSVLAHFGHITIKPLNYSDAQSLLQKPLSYLGYRIDEQHVSLISLILATTNYYPGLIHFYCQKLIEATATNYQSGTYSDTMSPPYYLTEEHIRGMLKDESFLESIREKFTITLQLDQDNFYFILATALACFQHRNDYATAASVNDIIAVCTEYDIKKITALTPENVKALLQEMNELNILRTSDKDSNKDSKYVFNRLSFFQMFGTFDKVDDKLIEYSLVLSSKNDIQEG